MKIKNIINILLSGAFILAFSLLCFFGQKDDYSESERRVLAKFPEVSLQSISSGSFAKGFEEYSTDRFPYRDSFRSIKAFARMGLFAQKDNNDIFLKDGHISKLEYPLNTDMLDHSIEVFYKVAETYLTDNKIYFAMIPDKNKDLAELKLDYDAVNYYMAGDMPYAQNIDITGLLSADDYYTTDTHWRQEYIVDVAEKIASSMGADIKNEYTKTVLDIDFYGVLAGQSAMPVRPDSITVLTNNTINGFKVEGAKAVYDMEKAKSRDPYELFLSGNQPIVKITNPGNPGGKRLVIFRDSFGSSIAPLIAQGYSEVTLVDLRYVGSDLLGQYVDFEDADILFLYSTLLLNNSLAIK